MSVYSLNTQSASNYYDKHLKNILDLSKKEYTRKYFRVGEKIDEEEQMFSSIMTEFLCTDNCELLNYINDKLEGKLEPKVRSLEMVDVDNGGNITYNITQVIRESAKWNEVDW